MAANTNRVSTFTTMSGDNEGRNGEQKKEIWLPLLDSVSSGKRLPEKNLIVLGMNATDATLLQIKEADDGQAVRPNHNEISSNRCPTQSRNATLTGLRRRRLPTTLPWATHITMCLMQIKTVCDFV